MAAFTWHWHHTRASALQTEWATLALWDGITIEDLAWELLGVDLDESPVPRAPAASPTIHRVTPEKREGHNPRVYGSPWFAHQPAAPYYKALPPSYPPPKHLLPSFNAPQDESTSLPFFTLFFSSCLACCQQVFEVVCFFFFKCSIKASDIEGSA